VISKLCNVCSIHLVNCVLNSFRKLEIKTSGTTWLSPIQGLKQTQNLKRISGLTLNFQHFGIFLSSSHESSVVEKL